MTDKKYEHSNATNQEVGRKGMGHTIPGCLIQETFNLFFSKGCYSYQAITLISRTTPECLQMVFELPDRDFMWRQEI